MKSIGYKKTKKFAYNILTILLLVCFFTNTVLAGTGQIVTDSITSSEKSFPDKKVYMQNGLQGVLEKNGEPISRVVSGSYIPGDSKTITEYEVDTGTDEPPATWLYNVDSYTATLNLVRTAHEDRIVDYEVTVPKFFSRDHLNIATSYYDSNGHLIRTEYSWDNSNYHPTLHIDEDGYNGDIDSIGADKIAGPDTIPGDDGSYKIVTTWRGNFEGTLTKKVINTVNETFYTGFYSGMVYKADNDTRVYEYTQNYRGCAAPVDLLELNLGNPVNSECVGEPVNM